MEITKEYLDNNQVAIEVFNEGEANFLSQKFGYKHFPINVDYPYKIRFDLGDHQNFMPKNEKYERDGSYISFYEEQGYTILKCSEIMNKTELYPIY